MSRLQTSFILGFHGCEKSVGQQILAGDTGILQSTKDFDWLGAGAYFWENDPQRAHEWAMQKVKRGDYKEPFVIGAVIDLGNCLDLLVRENIELVRAAYDSFAAIQQLGGLPLPVNSKAPKDESPDLVMRHLDCAVMNHLHIWMKENADPTQFEPYDSVRAVFPEGATLYEGAGFRDKNHCQIAVRSDSCIKGVFLPR